MKGLSNDHLKNIHCFYMILTNNRFSSYLGFTVYIESIVTKNPANNDRKIIKSYCLRPKIEFLKY